MGASGEYGGLYPFPTAPVERNLPGDLQVYTPSGSVDYSSQHPSFWNPDFAGDLNYYNEYWQFFADGGW